MSIGYGDQDFQNIPYSKYTLKLKRAMAKNWENEKRIYYSYRASITPNTGNIQKL